MKKYVLPIVATLSLLGPLMDASPANAANCNGAVKRAIAKSGGKLISVSTKQKGGNVVCVITLSIKGNGNKPPRLVTREVNQ